MLKSLTVSNFALVDTLEIHFGDGLTVITGESGAGKSILLSALGLVLGERAATDAIRPGTTRADVSAEFDLSRVEAACAYLGELELDDPEDAGRALVRRVVTTDGRSRAYLNGTPVTLGVLKKLTEGLIDIHGQDENQRLADPSVQRNLLDSYGVANDTLIACRDAYRAWQGASSELTRLKAGVQAQEDRAALLTYQLEELNAAAPATGEFLDVARQHKRLSQSQALKDAVVEALDSLSATETVSQVSVSLARLDDDHPDLIAARETLTTINDLLSDALRDLRSFESSLTFNPEQLDGLEQRLSELHDLARKHKVDPEQLAELTATLAAELSAIGTDRDSLRDLEAAVEVHETAYRTHAADLSRQRHASAEGFCLAVSECMDTLGIKGGALAIDFQHRETEHGFDAIEYHCITNPKYPAAPLSKVASGGERTRISLSIQIAAAERCQLPSLVLDEADVGVGGTTADVVGRLLRKLATHTQVLCITHAPQIAALGTHHLRVMKDTEQDTRIEQLQQSEQIEELARMLAGAEITAESRDYARTLLEEAQP